VFTKDAGIVGGAGHVGLPLALTFADAGLRTVIYDIAHHSLEQVRQGKMPRREEGGEALLKRVLRKGALNVCDSPDELCDCRFIVLATAMPSDENLESSLSGVLDVIHELWRCFREGQILVLRSTVFPGVTARVQKHFSDRGLDVSVAYCPERATQGRALREIREIPQIISGFDSRTVAELRKLFSGISGHVIELQPMEAEVAKLMTNAWRYIQFAAANQLYEIACDHGLDFHAIRDACRYKYPRMEAMPSPGFAAGPCLFKDTMQLTTFSRNMFLFGRDAMISNEGLPLYLVEKLAREHDLSALTAGILGMAFKPECDDGRHSLSYTLQGLLVTR